MYVGSQKLMQNYDQCLLKAGYSIEELVDKASDCLMKHVSDYDYFAILCGPGNNGADGLSLAIKLHQINKQVHIFIFEDENISKANRYYLNQCCGLNMNITHIKDTNLEETVKMMSTYHTIIDAIFGFGLKSCPRGLYQSIIEEVNCLYDKEIIAIDIPTGLNCNTGYAYQSVICATLTITLSAFKNGFLNPDSISFTGKVVLEKLDTEDVSEKVGLFQLVDHEYAKGLLKNRLFNGHKGHYGRIGMITGCSQYKGASFLSTKAAVYTGSGVVTTISCQEVIEPLTIFCPEATTMLRPPIFQFNDFAMFNALLLGSGLGLDIEAYRYVDDVLTMSCQPLVIDGDALTIISEHMDLLVKQDRPIILTPHMGEFHRLCHFDDEDDILFIAREFAKTYHVTLVLKGPYTIVSDGEQSFRVLAGNSAMSSGGMGDVLAGIITSLLGQGYSALNASLLGVYIHGHAGDEISKNAYTVIPSQVIEKIPQVMKALKK